MGQVLHAGQALYNGFFVARYNEDGTLLQCQPASQLASLIRSFPPTPGNFFVYQNTTGSRLWFTGTAGATTGSFTLQSDGNLVLYDASGTPRWSSNTFQHGTAPWTLTLQADGNLVLFDATGAATWASGTVPTRLSPPPPPP